MAMRRNDLSRAIEERIRRGEFTGKLPGQRELAELYGTTATTVQKALAPLNDRGIVELRGVGTSKRGWYVSSDLPPVFDKRDLIKRLRALARSGANTRTAADEVLCDALTALGHRDLVEAWRKTLGRF